MNPDFTLSKAERLHSHREIELLFREGKSFAVYPLRIIYVREKTYADTPVSILVSVSKKRFKHAVKRNLLKRRIKEAYRKNKHSLISEAEAHNSGLLLAFLYIGKDISAYADIEQSVVRILEKLKTTLHETPV